MANAIIQTIETPKRWRAWDTSSSEQIVTPNLLTGNNSTFTDGVGDWEGHRSAIEVDTNTCKITMEDPETGSPVGIRISDWFSSYSLGTRFKVKFQAKHDGAATVVAGFSYAGDLNQITDIDTIKNPNMSTSFQDYEFNISYDHATSDTLYIGLKYTDSDVDAGEVFYVDTVEIYKLESFGNNNHGQIYSGRGLEFDGVTDYLVPPDGNATANSSTSWGKGQSGDDNFVTNNTGRIVQLKATTAFWMNSYQIGTEVQIQDQNGGEWTISLLTTGKLNAAYLNDTYTGSSEPEDLPVFTGTTVLEKDTWYRIVIVWNMQEGTTPIKFYINGVEESTTNNGEIDATGISAYKRISADNNLRIGSYGAGVSRHFDGALADYQIWFGNWTADDVAFDYANPEQLALNRSGTSLTESNLKLWYPMNDGHRGQQSYILDASNTGLGDEIVEGGTYLSASDWDKVDSPWTFSNGVASINNTSGVNKEIYQNAGAPSNTSWKVIIETTISSGNLWTYVGGYDSYKVTTSGTHTFYITNSHGSQNGRVYLLAQNGFNGSVSSISVKPVNNKNHATTVFYSDGLSDFLSADQKTFFAAALDDNDNVFDFGGAVADAGDLADDPDGFTETNVDWAIDSGVGKLDNTTTEYGLATLPLTTVAGRTYDVKFDVIAVSGAEVNVSLGSSAAYNSSNKVTSSGAATNLRLGTKYVADDATSFLALQLTTNTSGHYVTIDNLTVQEVGTATGWTDADQQLDIPQTALQSYNQLAWFSGTNGADATLDSQISTSTNSWSLSFWLLWEDNGSSYHFIAGSGSNRNIAIGNTSDLKLYYKEVTTGTYHALSDAVIPQGEWLHIVVTATADTSMTAYINGEAQTTNSSMIDTELLLVRFMEGYNSNSYEVLGSITEISYYDDVLTQSEVNDLYNDGKAKDADEASGNGNLVGYWRNNGLAEWEDRKGSNDANTNNVTETILQQAGVDASRDCQGFLMNRQKDTNALNIPYEDDSNDSGTWVDLKDNPISDWNNFSVSAWVKPENLGTANKAILMLGVDNDEHFHFALDGQSAGYHELGFAYESSGAQSLTRFSTEGGDAVKGVEDGEWAHVTVVLSSGTTTSADGDGDTLTDNSKNWPTNVWTGGEVHNEDDDNSGASTDSHAVVTSNTATAITHATLTQGTNNDWDSGDEYVVACMYINGELVDTHNVRNTGFWDNLGTGYNDSYYIGYITNGGKHLEGMIDEVMIYDGKLLSAAEVKRNYNAGKRSHK